MNLSDSFRLSRMGFILSFLSASCSHGQYPQRWFDSISDEGAPSWEVLPQEAKKGEVILSKRNELGILSNFAHTPFEFRGKTYQSIEGFWQMMLYPESKVNAKIDPRIQQKEIHYPYSRDEVSQMVAFEARAAGDVGSKNMKAMNINWVSFEGNSFEYYTRQKGRQYELIRLAMIEKLKQNSKVREVLLSTGDLVLRPDHRQDADAPPSWKYYEIWAELREQLKAHKSLE